MSSYQYHVISTNAELITSPFGYRTFNGVTEHHDGVDFVDEFRREKTSNVYINAFADGKVVASSTGVSVGNYVDILHDGKILTRYFHMKTGSVKVTAGQEVKRGDIIGIMGTTGNSTGIHLHFGVKENSVSYTTGTYVNPIPYLTGEKAIPQAVLAATAPAAPIVSSSTPIVPAGFITGDKVKVSYNKNDRTAKTYEGLTFKCYYDVYDVIQIPLSGSQYNDRIIIGIGKTVTAAVNKNILIKAA
ncbi:MAG: M23 family metallopeptidase [Oscillospiraceae bacterium]|nr:M23 family metallopeptidase [Oscillospiraceae bacterium]